MARELLGSWQNPSLGQQILATAGLTGVATSVLHTPTMTPVSGPMASGQFDQAALLSLMRQHQHEQNSQLGGGGASMLRSHSTSTAGLATSSGVMGGGEGEVGSSRGVSPDVGQGQLRDEPGGVLGGLSSNYPQAPQWRQAYAGGVHTMPTTSGTSPVQTFASPSLSSQPSPGGPTANATATISAPTPSAVGPGRSKQRARRGQATDPHSIAERLRRERIADRMKSLQELVPNSTRVDKASMLDEIIEYVRFLQLQVKVLSMSRLDGPAAEAVMQLMEELEKDNCQSIGAAGLTDAEMKHTERQVALLLETDMGSAMQYLQSKGLCLMPLVLTPPSPEKNTLSVKPGVKLEPGGNEMDLEECGDHEGMNEGLQDTMEGMALGGVDV